MSHEQDADKAFWAGEQWTAEQIDSMSDEPKMKLTMADYGLRYLGLNPQSHMRPGPAGPEDFIDIFRNGFAAIKSASQETSYLAGLSTKSPTLMPYAKGAAGGSIRDFGKPAFEFRGLDGHKRNIYADGRVEGFPDGCIINSIPRIIDHVTMTLHGRIAELEAENAQLKSLSATPASDTESKPMDPSWPNDPVHRAVKDVIDGLAGGKVRPPAREALGKALDAANKPLAGKAASDGAVGRAIRLESASGWEAVRR